MTSLNNRVIWIAILVAALGYFVDIYDLILFSIVRLKSLRGIGVAENELLSQGVFLLNMQMIGMLLGGILWGIFGDKKGRLSVLFGSILLYSGANILNGLVHSVGMYAVLRFVAGIGLSGELGAGVTLVSEIIPKEVRGYGTMIVATVGILGAIVAATVGDLFNWRTAYFVGGVMGILLLILRVSVQESPLFQSLGKKPVKRGNLFLILKSKENVVRYLSCIFIGVPIWFVIGILITFSPEFGKALNITPLPDPGRAVMLTYIGLALGDLGSGVLSQLLGSRKKIVGGFLSLTGIFIAVYLLCPHPTLGFFYMNCLALGIAGGYWAVFVTIAAEQFGTNIRSTVTTTVPNFVRGSVVPLSFLFQFFKPGLGIIQSAGLVASLFVGLAFVALNFLQETHGKDLDYRET